MVLATGVTLAGGNKGLGNITNDNGTLKNKLRDRFCMDQNNGATTTGLPMAMVGCNGGVNQKFSLSPDQKTIQVFNGNLCLEVKGATQGAAVIQNPCNPNKDSQQWVFSAVDQSIRTKLDSNLCLDVAGGSADDGTAVIVFSCNNNNNQKWTFQ